MQILPEILVYSIKIKSWDIVNVGCMIYDTVCDQAEWDICQN